MLRFLYSDPAINYQSENFLVPLDETILSTHEMLLTVPEASIFRVYTEANSDVDIDLKLFMAVGSEENYEQIATASNGIYNEEVIVAKLTPYVIQDGKTLQARYKLKVLFWKWNLVDHIGCQTFNMELAVTPASMLGAYNDTCPHGGTCIMVPAYNAWCSAEGKGSLGGSRLQFPPTRFQFPN